MGENSRRGTNTPRGWADKTTVLLIIFDLYTDTPLTHSDLHQIHTKLFDARTKWFDIGQCLSVDNETLCSIKREFSNDGDRLREMLVQRLKSSEKLTLTILCNCLREQIVSRADLAQDIEEKIKCEG